MGTERDGLNDELGIEPDEEEDEDEADHLIGEVEVTDMSKLASYQGDEATHAATQYARGRGREGRRGSAGAGSSNVAVRQQLALDLRGQGYSFDAIAAKCGYPHRSNARRAVLAAIKAIAEDTAEEMRLAMLASYGPVRAALHRRARTGDPRAVEALVKLDERQCRLFGLDLTPEAAQANVPYVKRIILETEPRQHPVSADGMTSPSPDALWGHAGLTMTRRPDDDGTDPRSH